MQIPYSLQRIEKKIQVKKFQKNCSTNGLAIQSFAGKLRKIDTRVRIEDLNFE